MRALLSGLAAVSLAAAIPETVQAQLDPLSQEMVVYDQQTIALTGAQVIDGTGAAPKANQTLVIENGRILALGDADSTRVPGGATTIDMAGKTLLPGFVMVHEHLFYPSTREYLQFPLSFPLLYLAGGETTIRTAGAINAYGDLNMRDRIARGDSLGPDIDVTAPYLEANNPFTLIMPNLRNPDDARDLVDYWSGQGATSFKAYMDVTRAQLKAGIDAAHRHGWKITGHLCSVTYAEAAQMGIDNLEHGFAAATDFVKAKQPDQCPSGRELRESIAALDPASSEAQALIALLVENKVAVTSTLATFEGRDPNHPNAKDAALDLLVPEYQAHYLKNRSRFFTDRNEGQLRDGYLAGTMRMEKAFSDAGGLLLAGSDPTGIGGVVPGFSSKRVFALLVESGFSVPQTVQIMTLNGARFLERDADVGTLAIGKRADIVVIDGDLIATPEAIETMPLVFKAGLGIETKRIFDRLRGTVGLW
jgi:imidazolonepropionase-like amidohydrolase